MKLIFLIILLASFSSCVEEIPVEDIENEIFVDNSISQGSSFSEPTITFKAVESTTKSSVIIHWRLNFKASGVVQFGTSSNLGQVSVKENNFLSEHIILVSGLTANTLYYYQVKSVDPSGKELLSSVETFTTSAEIDNQAPTLTNFAPSSNVAPGTKSVNISFSTNEKSLCKYSTLSTDNFDKMTKMSTTDASNHSQSVGSLSDGKTFIYYVFCRDDSGNESKKGTITFNIPELSLDGVTLYATHCMSCHFALGNSTKKNRSVAQIKNAILTNGQMKADQTLQILKDSQIEAISQALKVAVTPPPVNPTPGTSAVTDNQKYMIGTRRFIASKLSQIFYEQDKDAGAKKVIDDNIVNDDGGLFGGNCNLLDLDCRGTTQVKSSGIMLPNSHPIRSAVLYNTCQQLLDNTKAISSALKAAGLSTTSSGDNAANIASLFEVFYPGISINNEISDDLREIYKDAKANNINDTDSWKLVMSPMCKSALFEAF